MRFFRKKRRFSKSCALTWMRNDFLFLTGPNRHLPTRYAWSIRSSMEVRFRLGNELWCKFDRCALENYGFEGFLPLGQMGSRLAEIPRHGGIYVVVRGTTSHPDFLTSSPAGWFKGLDPTYPIKTLEDKWIPHAHVIYIGKAGPKPSRHLQRRIDELLRFGSGEPIGHRGGRALWQLREVWKALIAWKPVADQDPRDAQRMLIREFKSAFGKPPFANFAS
jgi:hypothetical protein